MQKRTRLHPIAIIFALLLLSSTLYAETVGLFYDLNVEQSKFAAGDVKSALESKSFTVEVLPLSSLNNSYSNKKVVIALASNGAVTSLMVSQGGTIPTGLGEQAYSLTTTTQVQTSYWVLGGDNNGAMYGGLQIAENIKFNSLSGTYNNQEGPAILKRGIKLNYPLDANSPTYGKHDNGTFEGISYQNAIPNIWDMSYWKEWFDEMARNRYNVVSLWLCHPFTALVKMDEYPNVAIQNVTGFNGYTKTMTIDQKIAFWQEVMAYANARGFDFYFFNWNLFTYGATDKYGITSSISNTATVTYMYKSMLKLMETYPHLSGFGVTAGEKMTNDRPNNEQFLWDTYGKAIYDHSVANPTRKFHFIHRLHWTTMAEVKARFQPLSTLSNVNYSVSFKYSQAHMYACATPTWWDSNDEAELLSNGMKTWFTVRNDDFYYHNWGDPSFVRAYINAMPGKSTYLHGFYMGSDGYCPTRAFVSKNSIHNGILDIKRQWYMYMLMGRLSYNPNTSDDVFKNYMNLKYNGISSATLFDAWQKASRGIPKVSEVIGGSLDLDFDWWPEGCHFGRSASSSSFVTIDKFNASNTVPGSSLCNFTNSATGNCSGKKSTYQIATEIETDALAALQLVESTSANSNTELGVTINNIKAMSYLTVYYAYKLRAATDKKAGNKPADLVTNLGLAYCWWMKYANLMDQMYYGMTMQRVDDFPNWHHQDANVLKEYNDNGGIGTPNCTNTPQAPFAHFTANNSSIIPGETVIFTDQSTNTPTSWSWTFEGGNPATSADQNPIVSYAKLGTYSVTLVATNAIGDDTLIKTGYITVTNNPAVTLITEWVSGNTNNKISGNNRLMAVMVMGESTSDFSATSVTYGGLPMTKQTEKMQTDVSRSYTAIFTLNEEGVNAAASGAIAVTWSATPSSGSSLYSALLKNVDQTTPVIASATNGLTGTTVATSALAAASGEMVLMCGATANNNTVTFNTGFTKQFESNSGWGDGIGASKIGNGTSETPSFTQSASGRMALCAIVIKNATSTTNIHKAKGRNNVKVYPIPARDMINIDFTDWDVTKEIKIYNIFGELIYQLQTTKATAQIDVKALNLNGVAILEIIEGPNVYNLKVLIKK